jgi:hypothetical protein
MRATFLRAPWIGSTVGLLAAAIWGAQVVEFQSGIVWPQPAVIDPGPATPDAPASPPSDAVVLFDGRDLSAWEGGDAWMVAEGVATAARHSITSKQSFGDCQLHLEFATPQEVEGSGQGRGNSGVYLMDRYEVQILDSFQNETYFDGQCAAVYKQQPPMVNASRAPGEWQTLDIVFQAPRFHDDGSVQQPAYVTVFHNGVVVHHHLELRGSTSYVEAPKYVRHPERAPLKLQYHNDPVRFRNIWVRERVQPLVGQLPGGPSAGPQKGPAEKTDRPPG